MMPTILGMVLATARSASAGGEARAPPLGRVLVVLSASDRITLQDGRTHPTGFYLSEVAGPVLLLRALGVEVTWASPGGAPPTMDPASDDPRHFGSPERHAAARAL